MTEQHIKDMIREILAELAAEPSDAAAPETSPNVLVLFTGALLGFEDACASLGRLAMSMHLDWTQTDSARRILDQNVIESVGMTRASDSLITAHDALVVPTLTVNMVAKVTHGIGDCLASNVIAEFIMSNKPVIVATTAACPDSAEKRGWFPAMPQGYRQLLRENLARLKSFGVTLTAASRLDLAVRRRFDIARAADEHPSKVISEATIIEQPTGATVFVRRDAIITDLAHEAAVARGITITKGS